MLDVNAGTPAIDEPALLVATIKAVSEVSDLPICIDSSVMEALEAALAAYEGKALVNSVTAEDERMDRILPLVKKYGSAVIGSANDETGLPMGPEGGAAIPRRVIKRPPAHGPPPAPATTPPPPLPPPPHPTATP